jgi:hypothetical protein
MAITETKKLDYLWKKLGYGITATDGPTRKSASNESIPSPLLLRGDKIWVYADQIPSVMPTSSSEYVQVHNDVLSNTVECVMDNTAEPLRTWKTSHTDWIPAEFGPTYQVKVYVDAPNAADPQATGTRLFPDGTGNDEWFFDYASGVLHFIGDSLPTPVTNGKTIYISGARYVGSTGLSNFSTSGGSVPVGQYPTSDNWTANGAATEYTLSYTPPNADAIDVYVNDVLQRPNEIYTITQGNILKFLITPESGMDIYVKYRTSFTTAIAIPDNSIEPRHLKLVYTSDQYTGDGAQIVYDINPGHTVDSIFVIVNGSILPPTEYSVFGTMLTINTPPSVNDVIDIRYLPV